MYSNDITRTKRLSNAWKNPTKEKKKKEQIKGLCRINIRACFFLYQAKNGKEIQNCIVQRYEKKTCAKDIHQCPSHHRVYEIARFIDSHK
jgi:hypothetical protein